MKRKIAMVLIGLVLTASFGFAIDTEFSLACLGYGIWEEYKTAVFEKQIVPINEAFGLNADLAELEKTARRIESAFTWAPNIFATKISTSMPSGGIKYEIIRDGEILNSQSTTIQLGDTIRISPELDIGSDWIVEGASADTPPITILGNHEAYSLMQNLIGKHQEKYPHARCRHGGGEVEYFSTKTTEFNETGNYYIADNGYKAYIVPAFNGKKAGIQIFTSLYPSLTHENCKNNEDKIECKLTQTENLSLLLNLASTVYIDKIIDGDTAIDASWMAGYGKQATIDYYPGPFVQKYYYKIQVLPPGQQAPIADFHCTFGDKFECDASASFDPDGTIDKYAWGALAAWGVASSGEVDSSHGNTFTIQNLPEDLQDLLFSKMCKGSNTIKYGCRQAITITLIVTDNHGFTTEKTKTFDLLNEKEAGQENFTLTATHNHSTQMAQITAECEGTVTLDIEEAIEGKSELEKVEIPCGETTEIGPFTVKGAYNVIATNNRQTIERIFTVD